MEHARVVVDLIRAATRLVLELCFEVCEFLAHRAELVARVRRPVPSMSLMPDVQERALWLPRDVCRRLRGTDRDASRWHSHILDIRECSVPLAARQRECSIELLDTFGPHHLVVQLLFAVTRPSEIPRRDVDLAGLDFFGSPDVLTSPIARSRLVLNGDGWLRASDVKTEVGSGTSSRGPRARCEFPLYPSTR